MQEDQLSSICKENAGRGGEALAAAVTLPWDPPCSNMVLFWRKKGAKYLLTNNGKLTMYRLQFEKDNKAVHLKKLDVSKPKGGSVSKEAYLLYRSHLLDIRASEGYHIKQL